MISDAKLDTAMVVRANAARYAGRPDPVAERALGEAGRILICYGSLAPDQENGHILAPLGGVWSGVSIRGRLVAEGWGAPRGYPSLALDGEAIEIDAQAVRSAGLQHCWDALDHFAGEGFIRLLHPFTDPNGEGRVGNVYVLAARAGMPA